jgi:hypothetical protein
VTTSKNITPEEAGRQALPRDNPPARRRTDDLAVRARLRRAAAGRSRAKLFGRGVI